MGKLAKSKKTKAPWSGPTCVICGYDAEGPGGIWFPVAAHRGRLGRGVVPYDLYRTCFDRPNRAARVEAAFLAKTPSPEGAMFRAAMAQESERG